MDSARSTGKKLLETVGSPGRKKGGRRGKHQVRQGDQGTKVIDIVDSQGTPLAVHVVSANDSEVNLVESTLDKLQLPGKAPEHLLYDKAADSDPLRERLRAERGIELVCPHRQGRKKKPTQDGRACRRYKRRYKVERTHSWFHNFRRLVNRYETTLNRYLGWLHLACALITLKRL